MASGHDSRRLHWDACHNVRDIGGYATSDGTTTRRGELIRADSLHNLSKQGAAELVAYGVRTVIDLRGPWESPHNTSPFARRNPDADTVAYLNLPVIDVTEFPGSPVDRANGVEDAYRVMLDTYRDEIAAVLTAIARARPGGVLIHCHSGKDRTGLVTALLLSLAGVPDTVVAEDYALSDICLRPVYDVWLQNVRDDADPAEVERLRAYQLCPPDAMLATLAYLRGRYGGVEAYLLAAGVDPDDITRLRARIRAA